MPYRNPMSVAEIQSVVNAARQGEEIEMNSLANPTHLGDAGWIPMHAKDLFNFENLEYRTKSRIWKIGCRTLRVTPDGQSITVVGDRVIITRQQIEDILKHLR